MRFSLLAVGLLSCSSFLGLALTKSVSAQCVQADVSFQYNISGSRQPTERTNDVNFESNKRCSGNANVTTNVQGNEGGTGKVRQNRTVTNRIEPGNPSGTGINGNTVQIRVNPTVDVYNPVDNLKY